MLNNQQIKLLQTAVRAAGIRGKNFEGRYRMLLGQYRQPNGRPVTSCKQLNNWQLEDLLAICEANGWRMPGKAEDFYRSNVGKESDFASFAQQSAIRNLQGDLGWNDLQLGGLIKRMTRTEKTTLILLSSAEAYKLIEALKAMFGRQQGKRYSNLKQIQEDMEVAKDGKASQIG